MDTEKFIETELTDLDVPKSSRAWEYVFNQALSASEYLSHKELKALIQEHLELIPNSYF